MIAPALRAIGHELETLGEIAGEQASALSELQALALSTNKAVQEIQRMLARALDEQREIPDLRSRVAQLETRVAQ